MALTAFTRRHVAPTKYNAAAVKSQRKSHCLQSNITRRLRENRLVPCVSETAVSDTEAKETPEPDSYVPVLRPEDLPKGVRKEVKVNGKNVLLFWYRNQPYAIESRSPAEGAYSEGFIKAKFTQDYCIECPSTGTLFSLKDGSIVSWYPNNPVLRVLTPKDTCRPLEIYPIKITQDAIMVDVQGGGPSTRGGADTSIERNNVFFIEPKVYVEGSKEDVEEPPLNAATAATLAVAAAAIAIVGVAGTATALYYDDYVLLAGFWAVLLAAVGYFTLQYARKN